MGNDQMPCVTLTLNNVWILLDRSSWTSGHVILDPKLKRLTGLTEFRKRDRTSKSGSKGVP